MKSIKDFIYYYRSCPICKSWITLDADVPIPSTLEIREDRLIFVLVGMNGNENREYSILFNKNEVQSSHPFVFNDLMSTIKRLYYPDYKQRLKIEARCYGCNNFRYWSKSMIYSNKTKKLNYYGIGGERIRFCELGPRNERVSYIISNNYNLKETDVYIVRPNVNGKTLKLKMPFSPFKKINFDDKNEILDRVKKLSLLA